MSLDKEINTSTVEKKHGLIVKGVGGAYTILIAPEVMVQAKPRGVFRKRHITPTIGDYCDIVDSGDPDIPYSIVEINKRKNVLIRPTVANLDVLVIILSVKDPEPDFTLLDKLLIVCANKNIRPVIWLNKIDLDADNAIRIEEEYSKGGFEIIKTSHHESIPEGTLHEIFSGHMVAFAGQSGVGKSTLCNAITGERDNMEVGKISERLHRGKHTTRHAEIFSFQDGFLIDTPGFSSLDLADIGLNEDDVIYGYPELLHMNEPCRFSDCHHMGELGCAIEHVDISERRLARYRDFMTILIEKSKHYSK
ncbi:MAG TPA: ribosome small subunit-dependent GTPase A [Bacillota bacterium]|mgnify:CR=1 FL=1|nr:ribosome small subunit-dependent GTPase A [Bacillota bacterium]HPE38737.1 ribosome small subunit-dependent GTPase A [Bacillota bacterium]